jgi:hypothetical protein
MPVGLLSPKISCLVECFIDHPSSLSSLHKTLKHICRERIPSENKRIPRNYQAEEFRKLCSGIYQSFGIINLIE